MNNENVDLWIEYIKMELGFAELLRRRWTILGLHKGDESQSDAADVEMSGEGDMDLEKPLPEDDEDDSARKEILNGALVKEVITNAVKCE